MTSPRAMPALDAGPPGVTSATSAPSAPCSPKERARSGVTDWTATPIQPRTTLPCSRIWSTTQRTSAIGTANPMPTLPPAGLTMAALMPTTRPSWSTSGPPELPGLIDASVWMKSSYGPAPRKRPFALTMPAVAVCVRPNGLPIASTQSPTLRLSESPSGSVGSGCAALMWTRAMSVLSSLPTSFASNSSSVAMRTRILSAPLTTWLFVTTSPSAEMTKPEPRLRLTAGGSPKKRWRKSCIDSGGPCPSSPARPTVEMFTTAGSARARTSANEGSRSPAAAGVTPSRAPSATRPPRPAPAVGIRSARRARPGLQLDDVALGIADVDRRADPARAVADRGLADHLDARILQVADERGHLGRRDAEAEMVDIGAVRAPLERRDEIDHAAPRPQLDEPDRLDATLLDEPEDPRIEIERAFRIAAAENDVVEVLDANRPLAHRVRPWPRARPSRPLSSAQRARVAAPCQLPRGAAAAPVSCEEARLTPRPSSRESRTARGVAAQRAPPVPPQRPGRRGSRSRWCRARRRRRAPIATRRPRRPPPCAARKAAHRRRCRRRTAAPSRRRARGRTCGRRSTAAARRRSAPARALPCTRIDDDGRAVARRPAGTP